MSDLCPACGIPSDEAVGADDCPRHGRPLRAPAPVSAVAGPEPDEGLWDQVARLVHPGVLWDGPAVTVGREHMRAEAYQAADRLIAAFPALAAPAAAPVGDEEAREAAAAVIRRARYQPAARADRTFDQHLADELHTAGLLAAPGDEGAARAAVARVLAVQRRLAAFDCTEDSVPDGIDVPDDYERGLHDVAADLAAALSAVSGEHREAEAGQ